MKRVENVYYQEDAIIKQEGDHLNIELNHAVFRLQNFVESEITDSLWDQFGKETI